MTRQSTFQPDGRNTGIYRDDAAPHGGGGVTLDNQSDPPSEITTLVAPGAIITDGSAALVPAIIAADDPGAVGAGVFWLQTGINGSFVQLNCRNASDTDWVTITPVFHKGGQQIIDSPDGATEINVNSSGQQSGWATDGALSFRRYGPNVRFVIDGDGYHMQDLPTSDPGIAGVLWNSGGTLKVSAG